MSAPRCEVCGGKGYGRDGTCVPCFGTGQDQATASDASNVGLVVLVLLAVAVLSVFSAAVLP